MSSPAAPSATTRLCGRPLAVLGRPLPAPDSYSVGDAGRRGPSEAGNAQLTQQMSVLRNAYPADRLWRPDDCARQATGCRRSKAPPAGGVPTSAPRLGFVRRVRNRPSSRRPDLRHSIRVMNEEEEAKAISRLIERLVVRFPQVPTRRVEETVSSAHQAFEGARVRGFVPLLVEHDVLIQLKDLAGQADLVAKPEQGRLAGPSKQGTAKLSDPFAGVGAPSRLSLRHRVSRRWRRVPEPR